ncbi:MAG: glycosyltransferase [Chloroflexota bacterium]|nr:glycosyltransferase [Chloroflexota bacterium]
MLVCFSHLRWDFVWQRPQHLLTRFARTMPVYVVEEPEAGHTQAGLRVAEQDGVTVVTPLLPDCTEGFGPVTNDQIRELLTPLLEPLAAPREVILWYLTPMAYGAEPPGLDPALVVFDAMDELANFNGAPLGLREREQALMAEADLVFTGGPSLYEARKDHHPAVHCFPSGVETEHFAQAANGIPRPRDLASRPRPVLGYYGVIDERLDLGLIDAVAASHPEWTIAMIGPVAKISQADLPQRPNIVYYGAQTYASLPAFLACFDVALLPFARNKATRFISPTKTLEYLAAGKPVVSTPIADVIDLYGDVVRFGATPEGFAAAIDALLHEDHTARTRRESRSRSIAAGYDWDSIAARMLGLMQEAISQRKVKPASRRNRLTDLAEIDPGSLIRVETRGPEQVPA